MFSFSLSPLSLLSLSFSPSLPPGDYAYGRPFTGSPTLSTMTSNSSPSITSSMPENDCTLSHTHTAIQSYFHTAIHSYFIHWCNRNHIHVLMLLCSYGHAPIHSYCDTHIHSFLHTHLCLSVPHAHHSYCHAAINMPLVLLYSYTHTAI